MNLDFTGIIWMGACAVTGLVALLAGLIAVVWVKLRHYEGELTMQRGFPWIAGFFTGVLLMFIGFMLPVDDFSHERRELLDDLAIPFVVLTVIVIGCIVRYLYKWQAKQNGNGTT